MVVFGLSLTHMGCHTLQFDLFLFKVYLVNKQIKEIMNRRKNNPQGTNDKKKISPSLEMSTTDPPLTPPITSKLPIPTPHPLSPN